MPQSFALLRTRLSGPLRVHLRLRRGHLSGGESGRRGTRYFSTMPVTPIELSQSATSVPSRSQARML